MTTPTPSTTPTAAGLLRAAIDAAPQITVALDVDGDLCAYANNAYMTVAVTPEEEAALRLIDLLLAAAPHLPGLLDALATNTDPTAPARALRLAVTQAGGSL